jgi:hypothetical protein
MQLEGLGNWSFRPARTAGLESAFQRSTRTRNGQDSCLLEVNGDSYRLAWLSSDHPDTERMVLQFKFPHAGGRCAF